LLSHGPPSPDGPPALHAPSRQIIGDAHCESLEQGAPEAACAWHVGVTQ
jgi:hypothetical protein